MARVPSVMVTNEVTFYLAAAVLVLLTVESCIKLLNRDSFSITLAVYVTVFAWYFIDPFLNPEQYDYIPPSLISQSYGQVLIFLIAFRILTPVAMRWIVQRRGTGVSAKQRFAPEQMLIAAGALWFLLLVIGIIRMGVMWLAHCCPLIPGRGRQCGDGVPSKVLRPGFSLHQQVTCSMRSQRS